MLEPPEGRGDRHALHVDRACALSRSTPARRSRLNAVDTPLDADYDLVRACQEPDSDRFEAAFEGLYGRYRDRVYSIAYRITGCSADAMDVMQESFALLFRKIGSFRFDDQIVDKVDIAIAPFRYPEMFTLGRRRRQKLSVQTSSP